ncbi:MAG: hypothetical protein ACLTBV_16145 [Enterocloster bolteae]
MWHETEDGMVIHGKGALSAALSLTAAKDHRIAMTFAVTALCADGVTDIKDAECVGYFLSWVLQR